MSIEMDRDFFEDALIRELPNKIIEVRYPESETVYYYHPDGTEVVHYPTGTIITFKGLNIVKIVSAVEGMRGRTFIPGCGSFVEIDEDGKVIMMIDSNGNIVEL